MARRSVAMLATQKILHASMAERAAFFVRETKPSPSWRRAVAPQRAAGEVDERQSRTLSLPEKP